MSPVRILLAEDDPGHQEMLCSALTEKEPAVQIVPVGNGRDLLEAIRQAGPSGFDCVVIDFHLPDGEAGQVLRQFEAKKCSYPILIISSSSEQRIVVESMRWGATDFVSKTEAFREGELWNRVKLAIAEKQAVRRQRRRVTQRMRRLEHLAETDPLTGLSNRAAFNRLLHCNGRRIYDRRGSVSVVLLDIDRFKSINDAFGHACGDGVLREVAQLLRDSIENDEMVCRWGGEEFMIVKTNASLSQGLAWAETIRRKIERLPMLFDERPMSVTASLGLVSTCSDTMNIDTIKQADQALYLAKQRGRNRICSYEMSVFEEQCRKAESRGPQSPEQKLQSILECNREYLGPVRFEHLTSHAQRVSDLAVDIGRSFGLEHDELERLRLAGLFHDLGKFIIPEEILTKRNPLTIEERELLSRFMLEGAQMSLQLGADETVVDYIRHHRAFYERIGTNRARTVPLGARIVGLADALDAMTSHRPYQSARSTTNAIRELRRARGTQFDPAVVDVVSTEFQRLRKPSAVSV